MAGSDTPCRQWITHVVERYPLLYSAKRLDEWRALFSDQARVVRVEAGRPVSCLGIEEAMPEQREYAAHNERFIEVWRNVQQQVYGAIAVIKAEYRLVTDDETREGTDVLTLIRADGCWKIISLVYEQTGYERR